MATASVHHSILANHITCVQTPTRRNVSFRVRCMAEEKQPQQPITIGSSTNPPPPPAAAQTPIATPTFPPPHAAPKVFARGTDVAAQLADRGLSWFVITSVVLSMASHIPLSQCVSVESKSDGLMSSSAEIWNGRAAMLGLVALVLTEVAKGGALI
ncbi:hypothetical protein MKX01_008310 [Papaver californicum]|nr:hypothetical protein MKX01_008310 [Papaver californicum]